MTDDANRWERLSYLFWNKLEAVIVASYLRIVLFHNFVAGRMMIGLVARVQTQLDQPGSRLNLKFSPNQLCKHHRLSNFTATKLNPLSNVESSNASSSSYPPEPTRKKTLSSQNPPLVGAIGVENCLQVALA